MLKWNLFRFLFKICLLKFTASTYTFFFIEYIGFPVFMKRIILRFFLLCLYFFLLPLLANYLQCFWYFGIILIGLSWKKGKKSIDCITFFLKLFFLYLSKIVIVNDQNYSNFFLLSTQFIKNLAYLKFSNQFNVTLMLLNLNQNII